MPGLRLENKKIEYCALDDFFHDNQGQQEKHGDVRRGIGDRGWKDGPRDRQVMSHCPGASAPTNGRNRQFASSPFRLPQCLPSNAGASGAGLALGKREGPLERARKRRPKKREQYDVNSARSFPRRPWLATVAFLLGARSFLVLRAGVVTTHQLFSAA